MIHVSEQSTEYRPQAERRSPWWGVLIAVVGLAILALPIFWLAMVAAVGFSGCFLECSTPEPLTGWLAASAAFVLLCAPFLLAAAIVRRNYRMMWIVVAPVAVLLGLGVYGYLSGAL
ncbi:hypothetical protein LWF01_19045 [Saxibacter everestensis]|uniref:Transmembrane protein n=1 Tax=Saxibacter everestensis TaxID=2909229 RepID=A0ABY8QT31_9MICO|nr:hypothetical protein LWF01_19045 [Brevibacteriaceae bacterium ZFBP1038]